MLRSWTCLRESGVSALRLRAEGESRCAMCAHRTSRLVAPEPRDQARMTPLVERAKRETDGRSMEGGLVDSSAPPPHAPQRRSPAFGAPISPLMASDHGVRPCHPAIAAMRCMTQYCNLYGAVLCLVQSM